MWAGITTDLARLLLSAYIKRTLCKTSMPLAPRANLLLMAGRNGDRDASLLCAFVLPLHQMASIHTFSLSDDQVGVDVHCLASQNLHCLNYDCRSSFLLTIWSPTVHYVRYIPITRPHSWRPSGVHSWVIGTPFLIPNRPSSILAFCSLICNRINCGGCSRQTKDAEG